jgi:hypothetical protein
VLAAEHRMLGVNVLAGLAKALAHRLRHTNAELLTLQEM